MPAHSIYLARLSEAERAALEKALWDRQTGKCFLCDEPIDFDVHGDLHIDHIIPIVVRGADTRSTSH
jgi:5-methylcytosine-specific restriction endonuclease McrA